MEHVPNTVNEGQNQSLSRSLAIEQNRLLFLC